MDFEFSEEQQLFRESVRARVEAELVPNYMEFSRREGVEATLQVCKKLSEWGLLGYNVPEKYGGQGVDVDCVTMGVIAEELGRGSNAWGGIWTGNLNVVMMLNHGASEFLREKYLARVVKGELYIPGLLTEPHGGSDMGDVRVTAYPDGGDALVVNGAKASVSGGFGELMMTLVRMVPDTTGFAGLGLLLVPGKAPGVSISTYNDWGLKELARGDVFFDNVRVPKENVIAEPGKGFQAILGMFDKVRPCLSLMAIGCAERALEECIKYAKGRISFGKPLTKYEGISFPFAEHATRLEAAKLVAYKALWCADHEKPQTKYSAMAKWFGVESAIDALWFCSRTYGHLGYTSEMDIMQRMLDVMGWAWGDGGLEVQKMVVAREIGGREMIPYDRR